MNLLDLPNETLLTIFELLGPRYFGFDYKRMLVCKVWHDLALKVRWNAVCLDTKSIAKAGERLRGEGLPKLCTSLITSFAVELPDYDRLVDAQLDDDPLYNPDPWRKQVNTDIVTIFLALRDCTRLRKLRFQAWTELHPRIPNHVTQDYLTEESIKNFLLLGVHLTVTELDLDLCGIDVANLKDPQGAIWVHPYHMCEDLRLVLGFVKRLKVRSIRLCERSITPEDDGTDISLEEITINLDLTNENPRMAAVRRCQHCEWGAETSTRDKILRGLEQLKGRAPKIKKMQVIDVCYPMSNYREFDLVSNKTRVLRRDWSRDAEVMVTDEENIGPESGSESDIDSLSDF